MDAIFESLAGNLYQLKRNREKHHFLILPSVQIYFSLYSNVWSKWQSLIFQKPGELVYAELGIFPSDVTGEVVRPAPYVPIVYADVHSTQGPAPANHEEDAAHAPCVNNAMYAGVV